MRAPRPPRIRVRAGDINRRGLSVLIEACRSRIDVTLPPRWEVVFIVLPELGPRSARSYFLTRIGAMLAVRHGRKHGPRAFQWEYRRYSSTSVVRRAR